MCELREVSLRRLMHERVSTGNQNLRIRQHFPEVICQKSQITFSRQATQTLNEEILLPSEQRVDIHPSRNGWERVVLDEILLLALLLLLCFFLSLFPLFSTTAELEQAESPASSHDEEERGGKPEQRHVLRGSQRLVALGFGAKLLHVHLVLRRLLCFLQLLRLRRLLPRLLLSLLRLLLLLVLLQGVSHEEGEIAGFDGLGWRSSEGQHGQRRSVPCRAPHGAVAARPLTRRRLPLSPKG